MKTNKQLPETMRIMDIDPRNARQGGKAAGDDNESGSAANACRPEHVPEGRIPAGPTETGWRRGLLASVLADSALGDMQNAAREFQKLHQQANGHSGDVLDTWSTPPTGAEQARLIWEVYRSDAAAAERLSRAVTSLPEVGADFLGFRLIALLGKGAFGQVYLAEQGDLANRSVALKVAADIFGESQTLAQLQHTNIVPVYSIHRANPFQAVCMPYFGATTLADVLDHLQGGKSLPASGKLLVSTVNDRKLSTHRSLHSKSLSRLALAGSLAPAQKPDSQANLTRGADAALTLQKLEGMTYVEAVLWIGARLADGLAHAHERGILHRDLKPANVLLTDDGQPMLLDFNLSEDTKLRESATAASVGGTLPYMAPEHLEAFRGGSKELDARSDVYSLGVILYELLTGRHPFPVHRTICGDTLDSMIEDRRKLIPRVRRWNTAVSPAVESIVQHCLEADRARRYQSARQLYEDLERQLHDQTLKYASEPSPRERLRKWGRRHPRLASTTSVGIMLGTLLLVLATSFVFRGRQLARLQAQETLGQFHEDMKDAQFKLYSRHADRGQLEDGIDRCRATLGRFQVLDNPRWRELPDVRNLPDKDQKLLDEETGELLFLLARATALHGQYYAGPAGKQAELEEARHFNGLAEACFGKELSPRALWEQHADLAKLLGRDAESQEYATQAAQTSTRSARDYYLIAHKCAIQANFRQALELLQKATQEEPRNFSAWFVRGNCYYDMLQDGHAVACYNTCVALRPQFHWSWFNRGLAHLRLRNFRQAWDDFDQVVRLDPDLPEGYINRALAKQGLQNYREAIEDYTRALAKSAAPTRVYFLRSEARARAGDKPGAQRDFDKGLAWEPADEESWIARGLARRDRDTAGALADFEQALKLNPRSFDGLQNKAAILVDKFGKDGESLKVMEEAVKLYPESVLARGGRGVLLARVKKREPALDDARACVLLDTSPQTLYQVACIYALTSRENQEDRLQAMHLLSSALRGDFGLQFIDEDRDLDPLRSLPEFKGIVAAARALQTGSGTATSKGG